MEISPLRHTLHGAVTDSPTTIGDGVLVRARLLYGRKDVRRWGG